MKLTVRGIKAIRFEGKPAKYFDGGGLYLHVTRTARTWRYKYRLGGKERTYTIGPAELVTLAEARDRHWEARRLVLDGRDPVESRRGVTAVAAPSPPPVPTTGAVIDAWFEKKRHEIKGADKVASRLRHLRPPFRAIPITELDAATVLEELDTMMAHVSSDLGHRVHGYLIEAFDAQIDNPKIAGGAFRDNPARHTFVKRNLPRRQDWKTFAHTRNVDTFAGILSRIERAVGTEQTTSCLWLQPRLFLRPSELRELRWSEVNFEAAQLEIPPERMKGAREHLVPLADQCLARLEILRRHACSEELVFHSPRSLRKPLSNQALTKLLERIGVPPSVTVPHGFRHTASTFLNEREFVVDGRLVHFREDVIEAQLAHKIRGVRGTYNRAQYLKERRVMMQAYADWLEELAGSVTPPP